MNDFFKVYTKWPSLATRNAPDVWCRLHASELFILSTLNAHYLIHKEGSVIPTLQMRPFEHREVN